MPNAKNCIVFATYKTNDRHHEHLEFYAFHEDFNPVEDEKEVEVSLEKARGVIRIRDPALIARPLSVHKHCHILDSYASLGDRVYRAGGSYSGCEQCEALALLRPETSNTKVASMPHIISIFSRYVDCWDPIDNCWTVLPPLNVARPSPKLHILQGKLFAVGGYENCDEFRFIEMFDESSRCWISHSYPPSIVNLDCTRFVSAAVEQEGFILFGSYADDRFYAFWPSGAWKRMDHLPFDHDTLLLDCLDSPTVVKGNHLLWLDRCVGSTLVGFNIDDGNYFSINLASEGLLPSSQVNFFYPHLLCDENGELALVWKDCCFYILEGKGKGNGLSKDSQREASAGIHCCRFSIDFNRAHKGKKCCMLMSHKRCIGPNVADDLGAAFVAEVNVAIGIASASNNISRILPRRENWHFKRRKPTIYYPMGLEIVEAAHSAEKIDHAGNESMIWE